MKKTKDRQAVFAKDSEKRNKEVIKAAAIVGKLQSLLAQAKRQACYVVGAALPKQIEVIEKYTRNIFYFFTPIFII